MLKVEHLSFGYRDNPVLKDVSFTAGPGLVTAIVGINGTGKSTLLRCVSGLEAGKGNVYFFGNDCSNMTQKERMSYLSYLDQGTDCFVDLTVFEVVLLGRLERLSFGVKSEDIDAVNDILQKMKLSALSERKLSELSGGQRQMVFIAQTLAKEPRILIMDEPTSALDLNKQFGLMDFLKEITSEMNYITLITLHQLDIAMQYADQVIVLNDGLVFGSGTPEQVMIPEMLESVFHVRAEKYVDREGGQHLIACRSLSG